MGARLRGAVFWIGCAALLAVFAWGAWNIWKNGGTPGASPTAATEPVSVSVRLATSARRAALPGQQRVMVVGNSVAQDLASGFRNAGVATLDLGQFACTFPPSVTSVYRNPLTLQTVRSSPCATNRDVAAERVFEPAVVFWVVSDSPPPWQYHNHNIGPCSTAYGARYAHDLHAELAGLKHSGTKVVVTTEAYVRLIAGQSAGGLALPDRAVACANRVRRTVASAEHVRLEDLASWTRPDDRTLRPDGEHYTGVGADRAAAWLLSWVGQ